MFCLILNSIIFILMFAYLNISIFEKYVSENDTACGPKSSYGPNSKSLIF